MKPYYADDSVTLYHGQALDVLRELDPGSADCCVTSPPYYGLRDYGVDGQIGLEASPAEYVEKIRAVFAEVRRVLAADGTLWLNIGDSYVSNGGAAGTMAATGLGTPALEAMPRPEAADPAKFGRWNRDWGGLAVKNLLGVPWRVAFTLQDDGWILRNAIVWHKPNAMPESVTDRLSSDYEFVFLLAKSRRYWFNLDAIREPLTFPEALDGTRVFGGVNKGRQGGIGSTERTRGHNVYGDATRNGRKDASDPCGRNPGSVWDIPTQPFPGAHYAVMPPRLAERCVAAGCKPGGTVLDPFSGTGTTGLAAARLGHRYIGADLSAASLDLSLRTRLAQGGLFDSGGNAAMGGQG